MNGKTLTKLVDYNLSFSKDCQNQGTKTVRIDGIKNYTGTISNTYQIEPLDISSASVVLKKTSVKTKDEKPSLKSVTLNGKALNGDYYSVYYQTTQADKGIGTVKVIGKNNYKGTATTNYTIKSNSSTSSSTSGSSSGSSSSSSSTSSTSSSTSSSSKSSTSSSSTSSTSSSSKSSTSSSSSSSSKSNTTSNSTSSTSSKSNTTSNSTSNTSSTSNSTKDSNTTTSDSTKNETTAIDIDKLIEAAKAVHDEEKEWKYSTTKLYKNGSVHDIDYSLNNDNKVTCSSVYVACVLYKAGIASKDDLNVAYANRDNIEKILEAKGWKKINDSWSKAQKGDIAFYTIDTDKKRRIAICAGDGNWYSAGSNDEIQKEGPFVAQAINIPTGFEYLLRPTTTNTTNSSTSTTNSTTQTIADTTTVIKDLVSSGKIDESTASNINNIISKAENINDVQEVQSKLEDLTKDGKLNTEDLNKIVNTINNATNNTQITNSNISTAIIDLVANGELDSSVASEVNEAVNKAENIKNIQDLKSELENLTKTGILSTDDLNTIVNTVLNTVKKTTSNTQKTNETTSNTQTTNTTKDTQKIYGDVNLDGKVNMLDVYYLNAYYGGEVKLNDTQIKLADVNGDGKVTPLDQALIIAKMGGTIKYYPIEANYGDLDEDGNITMTDCLILFAYLSKNSNMTAQEKATILQGFYRKVNFTEAQNALSKFNINVDISKITNMTELQSLIEKINLTDKQKAMADVNGSGVVNLKDLKLMIERVNGTSEKLPMEKYFMYGDVDGDRKITSADSLLVLRYAKNLEEFTDVQKKVADVNADGNIDKEDAELILKRSVDSKIVFEAEQ